MLLSAAIEEFIRPLPLISSFVRLLGFILNARKGREGSSNLLSSEKKIDFRVRVILFKIGLTNTLRCDTITYGEEWGISAL